MKLSLLIDLAFHAVVINVAVDVDATDVGSGGVGHFVMTFVAVTTCAVDVMVISCLQQTSVEAIHLLATILVTASRPFACFTRNQSSMDQTNPYGCRSLLQY